MIFSSSTKSSLIRFVCIIAFACMLATNAFAGSICVSSSGALFSQLKEFSDGGISAGQDVDFELVRGFTFQVGPKTANGSFVYHSTATTGDMSISGGWNAGCTQQTLDAKLTILDGGGLAQVLRIDSVHRKVDVSFVTIQNGNTDKSGGGLAINTNVSQTGTVVVADNIIQNNTSTTRNGGLAVYVLGASSPTPVFELVTENLIAYNTSDLNYGAGYIDGESVAENGALIDNNTVYRNVASGSHQGGLAIGGTGANSTGPLLFSNIFWANTNDGLVLFGTPASFYYNDYGNIGGVMPLPNATNVTLNPNVVDGLHGNFHLSSSSQLIQHSPPAGCSSHVDLEGHVPSVHSRCEPGAYQETIFANGLDGVF